MHIMNQALHLFIGKFVIVYFENILIFSSSMTEHKNHIRQVLEVLRHENLFVARHEWEFSTTEVRFLGYIVLDKGLSVDVDKVASIRS